ncbi:MAG: serine/threonine-protein kinase [Planctomycetota bacterium]
MDSDRHARVSDIFSRARRLTGDDRKSLLDEACGADNDLRAEVESLLTAIDDTANVLSTSHRDGVIHALAGAGEEVAATLPTIPGYTIREPIGQGGMGIVYRAEQEQPRRDVALKLMSTAVMSPEMLRRFEYEAEVLGRLRHPGIAAIYEAGTFESGGSSRPYFAMEFIAGEPLRDYARTHELSVRERLSLMAEIADAVHHAHQRGVIHRDLKPANVLVDAEGQAKILDFGIARATDADVQATVEQTDLGRIIGTLAYMSPEQAQGDSRGIDIRSDVYALGVVAYELLTGTLPVDVKDCSLTAAVQLIQDKSPTQLGALDRTLRGDVETIIGKALEKERDLRYDSAAALADDIRRYLNDEPIVARPPSTWYQLRKFARRRKPVVAAAAFSVLVLIAATAVSLILLIQTKQALTDRELALDQKDIALAEKDEALAGEVAARKAEEEQRELAERRFDDVRALANTVLFDIDRDVRTLSGSLPVRQKLVTTAQSYLNRLAEDAGDNFDLLDELATAWQFVGDVQGNPRIPNIGDTDAAMESYRNSMAIRERLYELRPDDPNSLGRLAMSYTTLAEMAMTRGETDVAIDAAEKAVENMDAAAAKIGDAMPVVRSVVISKSFLMDAYRRAGRPNDALPVIEEAVKLGRTLAERGPGDPNYEGMFAVVLGDYAACLMDLDRHEDADTALKESLEIRERFARQFPDNGRMQRDLTITLARMGRLAQRTGDYERSLELHQRIEKLYRARVEATPESMRAQLDHGVVLERLGTDLFELQRYRESIDRWQECIDLRLQMSKDDPSNVYTLVGLSRAYEGFAESQFSLGDNDLAAEYFALAMETVSIVIAQDPRDALARTILIMSRFKRGLVAESTGDDDDPCAWYRLAAEGIQDATDAGVRLQATPNAMDEKLIGCGEPPIMNSDAGIDAE